MSAIDPGSAPHHTERTVGDATVVELRGEIDIFTAPSLAARLEALTAGPRPDLVLDLRSMAFIDCTGLGVLCRARNRALARNGRLRLVTGSRCFRRVLRAAGLAGVFELHTSLSTDLARSGGNLTGSSPTGPAASAVSPSLRRTVAAVSAICAYPFVVPQGTNTPLGMMVRLLSHRSQPVVAVQRSIHSSRLRCAASSRWVSGPTTAPPVCRVTETTVSASLVRPPWAHGCPRTSQPTARSGRTRVPDLPWTIS
jgi:anti-anti-sigma factor